MGNRLRATFTAERDDIERRHLAEGQATAPGRSRSLKWIPFAVAAALIAIAGFAFIASRDTDRAVDLDTATQPADEEVPDNQPSEVAGPVDAEGNPLPTPNTIPIGTEPIPYLTGENMCGDLFEPELAIVAGRDGADAPAIAEPDASETVAPLRMLAPGSTIELVGGCTRGLTSLGTLQWYELKGEPGEPNDWILSTDLQPTPRTGPTPAEDSLDVRPCTQGGAPQVNPENDQLYLSTSAGDQNSPADHVHDIRTESNDTCTRIVVTFGENANEDADGPAAALPPIIVYKGSEFVRISPSGWAMESAFMDPDRIDYPGGIGLLAINPGFNFSVELMHREMEPHVRFFDNPARVVVDLYPVDSPDPTVTGPFGERFVLRAPIQSNLTGNEVFGFGRPFEAAGLYRIWSVPDDVDADEFLAESPAPQLEAFFPTSGWAEGWGSFNVDLPELAPGTYIAVFGELPPTDEIGFYGTGQLFRVTEAGTVAPDAVLLPDVQLPPE